MNTGGGLSSKPRPTLPTAQRQDFARTRRKLPSDYKTLVVKAWSSYPPKQTASTPEAQYIEHVVEFIRYFGIDPVNEADLIQLAEEAMLASVPQSWQEVVDDLGTVTFLHPFRKKQTVRHPLDDFWEKAIQKKRADSRKPAVSSVGQGMNNSSGVGRPSGELEAGLEEPVAFANYLKQRTMSQRSAHSDLDSVTSGNLNATKPEASPNVYDADFVERSWNVNPSPVQIPRPTEPGPYHTPDQFNFIPDPFRNDTIARPDVGDAVSRGPSVKRTPVPSAKGISSVKGVSSAKGVVIPVLTGRNSATTTPTLAPAPPTPILTSTTSTTAAGQTWSSPTTVALIAEFTSDFNLQANAGPKRSPEVPEPNMPYGSPSPRLYSQPPPPTPPRTPELHAASSSGLDVPPLSGGAPQPPGSPEQGPLGRSVAVGSPSQRSRTAGSRVDILRLEAMGERPSPQHSQSQKLQQATPVAPPVHHVAPRVQSAKASYAYHNPNPAQHEHVNAQPSSSTTDPRASPSGSARSYAQPSPPSVDPGRSPGSSTRGYAQPLPAVADPGRSPGGSTRGGQSPGRTPGWVVTGNEVEAAGRQPPAPEWSGYDQQGYPVSQRGEKQEAYGAYTEGQGHNEPQSQPQQGYDESGYYSQQQQGYQYQEAQDGQYYGQDVQGEAYAADQSVPYDYRTQAQEQGQERERYQAAGGYSIEESGGYAADARYANALKSDQQQLHAEVSRRRQDDDAMADHHKPAKLSSRLNDMAKKLQARHEPLSSGTPGLHEPTQQPQPSQYQYGATQQRGQYQAYQSSQDQLPVDVTPLAPVPRASTPTEQMQQQGQKQGSPAWAKIGAEIVVQVVRPKPKSEPPTGPAQADMRSDSSRKWLPVEPAGVRSGTPSLDARSRARLEAQISSSRLQQSAAQGQLNVPAAASVQSSHPGGRYEGRDQWAGQSLDDELPPDDIRRQRGRPEFIPVVAAAPAPAPQAYPQAQGSGAPAGGMTEDTGYEDRQGRVQADGDWVWIPAGRGDGLAGESGRASSQTGGGRGDHDAVEGTWVFQAYEQDIRRVESRVSASNYESRDKGVRDKDRDRQNGRRAYVSEPANVQGSHRRDSDMYAGRERKDSGHGYGHGPAVEARRKTDGRSGYGTYSQHSQHDRTESVMSVSNQAVVLSHMLKSILSASTTPPAPSVKSLRSDRSGTSQVIFEEEKRALQTARKAARRPDQVTTAQVKPLLKSLGDNYAARLAQLEILLQEVRSMQTRMHSKDQVIAVLADTLLTLLDSLVTQGDVPVPDVDVLMNTLFLLVRRALKRSDSGSRGISGPMKDEDEDLSDDEFRSWVLQDRETGEKLKHLVVSIVHASAHNVYDSDSNSDGRHSPQSSPDKRDRERDRLSSGRYDQRVGADVKPTYRAGAGVGVAEQERLSSGRYGSVRDNRDTGETASSYREEDMESTHLPAEVLRADSKKLVLQLKPDRPLVGVPIMCETNSQLSPTGMCTVRWFRTDTRSGSTSSSLLDSGGFEYIPTADDVGCCIRAEMSVRLAGSAPAVLLAELQEPIVIPEQLARSVETNMSLKSVMFPVTRIVEHVQQDGWSIVLEQGKVKIRNPAKKTVRRGTAGAGVRVSLDSGSPRSFLLTLSNGKFPYTMSATSRALRDELAVTVRRYCLVKSAGGKRKAFTLRG